MINASRTLQSLLDQSQADLEMGHEIGEEEKRDNLNRQTFLHRLNCCIEELGSMQLTRRKSTVGRDGRYCDASRLINSCKVANAVLLR
jgi:hypothetical protein